MPVRLWQEAGVDRFVGHLAALEGELGQAGPGDPGPLGTCSSWLLVAFLASQGAGEMVLSEVQPAVLGGGAQANRVEGRRISPPESSPWQETEHQRMCTIACVHGMRYRYLSESNEE